MDFRAIIAMLACLGQSVADNAVPGTVIFANILFRHGDRTPVDPYPNDPYNNEALWPVPFGQLTNLGKHQHLLLGRWFRNRYAHLLPDAYSLHDVYVRSTDVDRTLMSAQADLAGLYPPRGNQIWDTIKWMPIPVHTAPEHDDGLLAVKKPCPRYDYELEKVENSPEMRRINEEYKQLYDFLTEKTGKKISSMQDVQYIYSTLFIETLYNKTLPGWTSSVFPYKLKPLAERSFTVATYNKILQKLKSGPLLGEMAKHMSQKSKGALSPDRKLWIYSAHDTTVANLLMTLGLFEPHCPPYTATVLIELRMDTRNQYFVTISYKNTTGEPNLLTLPGCVAVCPLTQFIHLTKSMIPDDWEKECSLNWEQYGYTFGVTSIVTILTSSIMMLILLILLIVAFAYWHFKRDHRQYYLRLTTDPI